MNKTFHIAFLFSFAMLLLMACGQEKDAVNGLFKLLSPQQTGIDFNNTIIESDSFNMYRFMNIYTGGGLAVGDINNDGLEDVFFSGNQVSSQLYVNKGNLQFEEITVAAGLTTDRWCAGASMVDINQDGWLDIYISVTGSGTDEQLRNLLFVNQGDLTFKEEAKNYGLADPRQCMHTSFFDYDRDGDLDAYVIVNPVNYNLANVNNIRERYLNGESESTDRLYRNNGDNTFSDVSTEAGILIEGYSLGLATCDINGDHWPDIYVSNDFLTNDILYINNADGTFSNQAAEMLDHTSFAGMGSDISDFNNDALPDIMVVDMLPEDHFRRQSIIPGSSYDKFQLTLQKGYEPQYTRNTLQLNRGNGKFSEIGQLAGVDQTDWSWSTLFADYDNDGDKDLLVTNGFLRDVGNLDYIKYQQQSNTPFGKKEKLHEERLKAIQELGAVKIQNYVFENEGELQFKKRTNEWGFTQKTCSNGAAFSDLDLDGDLDLIINNVNDPAFVYENQTNKLQNNKYLKINLKGSEKNRGGLGTKVYVKTSNGQQYYQHHLYRGYESTISRVIHFGLGTADRVDSLKVIWPDGAFQMLTDVSANQTLELQHENARKINQTPSQQKIALLEPIKKIGLEYLHREDPQIDFKVQALLPHQHSKNGPGIAVGDINGDGLEDAYIGGATGFAGQFFWQQANGHFQKQEQKLHLEREDMGSLLFDADLDGDLDLYIVSGGSSAPAQSENYQDRFYENDGKGHFTFVENALPKMYDSGSCVVAADYDRDGDLDLFVGGRIVPGKYPLAANSYLLRNDSKNGTVQFTNVNNIAFPKGNALGLVSSALWTDYDGDGWTDLLICGEWMPLLFYKNEKGQFKRMENNGLAQTHGWWNSLVAADFDQDGDTDYLAGNLGLNARYRASVKEPVCIYASDYDKNGRIDPIMCHYINGTNYIAHPRDQLIQQINAMRVRFKNYRSYAETDFAHSFTKTEIENAQVVKSETFANTYLENLGNGQFKTKALPISTQVAPIFGMLVEDYNRDGNLDVLTVGNSFATEVALGAYDASDGVLLLGDGTGDFKAVESTESGFLVDSDAKGFAKIQTKKGDNLYLVTSNADQLKVFGTTTEQLQEYIPVSTLDVCAILKMKNGKTLRQELYYGSTYLSQSSRNISIGTEVESVEIINSMGAKRLVKHSLK